ncbi:hypothetical protein Strain138_002130 [Pseudogemmatithrix spongiicola]|uniref:Uncharacterized protein n=1 Tax=Pseudogemmatithrix spongiicola TaxID=3062599 RepID=A0AA49JVE5_9BACT|nr:hypothetical protein Strain138_002130 [Gemmatimonadaceae bacterium 'strain 138']WKW15727.1 hypothetical protein Strain318_002129 [Gemmatimonadaceae bacterium 'strain 318']
MVSPRLARSSRWLVTSFALFAFASALTGGLFSPVAEPRWQRLMFATGVSLLAASAWVAPIEAWLTLPPSRKRLFYGLVTAAILLGVVQLSW